MCSTFILQFFFLCFSLLSAPRFYLIMVVIFLTVVVVVCANACFVRIQSGNRLYILEWFSSLPSLMSTCHTHTHTHKSAYIAHRRMLLCQTSSIIHAPIFHRISLNCIENHVYFRLNCWHSFQLIWMGQDGKQIDSVTWYSMSGLLLHRLKLDSTLWSPLENANDSRTYFSFTFILFNR